MNIEKVENRIRALTNQHTTLETELNKLVKESADQFKIENVKKKKLLIKDELSRLHRTRHDMMSEIEWE